jgi:long-chain acyl-CoA synthetase
MNFCREIFERLARASEAIVLEEIHDSGRTSVTGAELLRMVGQARAFVRGAGIQPAQRCALLAPNSIRWLALALALIAEGAIVVPLYFRQSSAEVSRILRNAAPVRLFAGDSALLRQLEAEPANIPPVTKIEEAFAAEPVEDREAALPDDAPVAIIYTSGTSGEPKGVVLTAGNLNFMLGCTSGSLDQLMHGVTKHTPDRVFHYLPFNFAASWIVALTCLRRNTRLMLSSDLTRLADELRLAAPDYFLNVPTLLERLRAAIEDQMRKSGGLISGLFFRAEATALRILPGKSSALDLLWLSTGRSLLFPRIRARIGANLKALICGSAPLSFETQLFFAMLGIPVLQGYGLTETTGICTLDDPASYEPGRVGRAIPGIEMKLGESNEILVRGPNIFAGYWNRPEETTRAIRDGWFHTGDQGEVDSSGNWRITGRLKNLIILNSGHNIAPEALEDELIRHLHGSRQAMVVGNDRSFLLAVITGEADPAAAQEALDAVNAALPHYKKIRGYILEPEPFTIENGLFTTNGKIRRDAAALKLSEKIESAYRALKGG